MKNMFYIEFFSYPKWSSASWKIFILIGISKGRTRLAVSKLKFNFQNKKYIKIKKYQISQNNSTFLKNYVTLIFHPDENM